MMHGVIWQKGLLSRLFSFRDIYRDYNGKLNQTPKGENIMKANEFYTRNDFITYLEQIGARFEEHFVNGLDLIYVYDKKAYDNKKGFIRI